jgi:hypothetical protein
MSEYNFTHGTQVGYGWHLCRCDECREAHRLYSYHRRSILGKLKTQGPILPRHGTRYWYTKIRCRCDLCRNAERSYRANLRSDA